MQHSHPSLNFRDSFMESLACAALQPGLRSILLYDSSIMVLQRVATTLSQMLQTVTKNKVIVVTLGVSETEDDLWGGLTLRQHHHSSFFVWQLGRLASLPGDQRLRLVVIPNLAQLSLPAARACVMLMGTEVAYLQRHGQNITWTPNFCWLAGCARSDIGQVSPHLLDRFALRLSVPTYPSTDRVVDILFWLSSSSIVDSAQGIGLSSQLRKQLDYATHQQPSWDKSAVFRVLEYFPEVASSGLRREIALARLATAHSQLMRSTVVTTEHVDHAAALIKLPTKGATLKISEHDLSASEPLQDFPPDIGQVEHQVPPVVPSENLPTETSVATWTEEIPIHSPDIEKHFLSAPIEGPYVEDTSPIEREAASLQLPLCQYRPVTMNSGFIVGTERATALYDLAIISTLMEAAKYQAVRRKYSFNHIWKRLLGIYGVIQRCEQDLPSWARLFPDRLLISATDLRCYRRSPVPEQLLVLVLDYTCLQDCDWEEALFPHLQWAYIVRANICLIQVGAATATGPGRLRAHQITAHSILAPSVSYALNEKPGCATPLAHGLDLAVRTLQSRLQHGRSAVCRARLVVVSDGRGNVPLEASRAGTITWPVMREGIEDALQVAHIAQGLKCVETFLLHPQPQQYPDLPIALADALGTAPSAIQLKDARR